MIFIGLLSVCIATGIEVIGLLPQIYKSFKTKSTTDISMLFLINYLVGSIAWIIWGICMHAIFTTAINIIRLITSIIAIYQKIIYDKNR